jgi:hypothetical protein
MSREWVLPAYTGLERCREVCHTSKVLYKRAQRNCEQNKVLLDHARQLLKRLHALLHDLDF